MGFYFLQLGWLSKKADNAIVLLFFAVFLFWSITVDLYAQKTLHVTTFTSEDGLLNNNIVSFAQDSYGYVWIGTDAGLNRFDGQHFLSFGYDPEDPKSLSGNFVSNLFEDSQKRLWIGTSQGLNLLERTSETFIRIPFFNKNGEEIKIQSSNIYGDNQNTIWASTNYNGLFRLEEDNEKKKIRAEAFAYQTKDSIGNQALRATKVVHRDNEYLWVSTNLGIDRFHIPSGKIDRYFIPGFQNMTIEFGFTLDLWDGRGNIILRRGVNIYYLNTDDSSAGILPIKGYFEELSLEFPQLAGAQEIVIYSPHLLFVFSKDAIFWLNLLRGETIAVDNKIFNNYYFPLYNRYSLLDNMGNIWTTLPTQDIIIGSSQNKFIDFLKHDANDPSSISKDQVRSITKDDQGNLWVGLLDSGLEKFKIDDKGNLQRVQNYLKLEGMFKDLNYCQIIELINDNGYIWIATTACGIYKLNPQSLEYEHFWFDPQSPSNDNLSSNRIWGVAIDPSNKLWLGTWKDGLNYLDPKTKQVEYFKANPEKKNAISSNFIRTLYLEKDSVLWIGTKEGLNRMRLKDRSINAYLHKPEDPNSISSNRIWSILEDQQGDLWIGTSFGLNRLNRKTGQFERFFKNDGLPDNTIYGLLEDKNGRIWISTQNGLAVKVSGENNKPVFYTVIEPNSLESTEFLAKAQYRDEESGILYFGTSRGLVTVNPNFFQEQKAPFKPGIHSFKTYTLNDPNEPSMNYNFLNKTSNKLQLSHRDKIIEIAISDLSWDLTNQYKYEYKLSGFNRQWTSLEKDKIMSFSNLDPGNYSLWVRRKTLSQDLSAEEQLIAFRVLPPWWQSWWAYAIYVLSGLATIYGLYRFQLHRQFQKQETENLKALDAFKNELYTNITHEFRTPLTVINGMIDQIKGHEKARKLIKRNSLSLLNLVNQILDLRRMELGKLQLELVQADVIPYLQYIMESYATMGELKGIQLHFIPKERILFMDFDQEKLLRVVSNLLSNAIKYTPDGGQVYFIVDKSKMEQKTGQVVDALNLSVSDTGMGIPKEQQAYIFDRFYQVKPSTNKDAKKYAYRKPGEEGSGIGLALTRDLVSLMKGIIAVKSKPGEGSTFTVSLPINCTAPKASFDQQVIENYGTLHYDRAELLSEPTILANTSLLKGEKTKLSLLIIEDNKDVQEYLNTLLETEYHLSFAANGADGIDMAIQHIPDLIISDVMMPLKNGFEVCDTLKQDDRTSHIPIILLTAKSSDDSRIEGLTRGADAYLAKPFNEKELFVRLEKLAELRQRLQQRYQHFAPQNTSDQPKASNGFEKEDAFIKKLKKVVEKHLGDSAFGANQLCEAIGMSRSQLHLKIKALTGVSTSIFIRNIRLQKAKDLLQKGGLNVSQVAYDVGFNSPTYFSTKFSEAFGMQPSEVNK